MDAAAAFLLSIIFILASPNIEAAQQFSGMFVFGDSLVDDGNNNLLGSLAKANYFPYGIDFYEGPSGRFCNGKTIIDFLGELMGLPYLPAFASTFTSVGINVVNGVNYASAGAGILDETGLQLGDRFSLSQQVQNFETTLNQLKSQMDEKELSQYLAKALAVMILGSNDYINNYLLPSLYTTSSNYTPKDYADLLIGHYTSHILALQSSGLRKFLLAGVGPLGCIPNQLASGRAPEGECVSFVNDIVEIFNTRLRSLVDQLTRSHPGSIFVYGNTYGVFTDILNNPDSFGFSVANKGCCGIGRNQGQITCLPMSIPCLKRDQYVFWDAFHPTEAVNQIIARRAYGGPPSDCYPINVKKMAEV
ncbi:GDSL esterase/lipase At5g08460-like [Alnus glutinosa]|uniref:GDSL esterase/lipase At5g08460-like n=1 Tax=Alnus glutinosa TaxID=3517 RepID=UPI002D79DB40|nr:GDSL esterase/lipase At5g08460-like [Alnus glutinosa]